MDFRNPQESFSFAAGPGKAERRCPSLRLHFHPIANKPKIMATIEAESLYSWDIPIYYAETADYLVVTSPGWINGGVYTDEAQKLAAPLQKALKAFFQEGKAAMQD